MFYDKSGQEIAYVIYSPINWNIDINQIIITFPVYVKENILYKKKQVLLPHVIIRYYCFFR